MTREEMIKGLNELAWVAPTPYLVDVAKAAARELYDMHAQLDFMRRQNQELSTIITGGK